MATAANTPDSDAVSDLLADHRHGDNKPVVLGDSAYADGATRQRLDDAGFVVVAKYPPVRNSTGGFTKQRFDIDLHDGTVTCPTRHSVAIRLSARGDGSFASVAGLIAAIEDYIAWHNAHPKPYVWKKSADDILAKVRRGRVALAEAQTRAV